MAKRKEHSDDCLWATPVECLSWSDGTRFHVEYWGCTCGAHAFNLEHEDDPDFDLPEFFDNVAFEPSYILDPETGSMTLLEISIVPAPVVKRQTQSP